MELVENRNEIWGYSIETTLRIMADDLNIEMDGLAKVDMKNKKMYMSLVSDEEITEYYVFEDAIYTKTVADGETRGLKCHPMTKILKKVLE